MRKYIGVLGATGIVGQSVINTLSHTITYILAGVRNLETKLFDSNIKTMHVDIDSDKEVYEFCKRCYTVINCVGPSDIVLDKIAKVCVETETNYVDVSGDDILIKSLLKWNKDFENRGLKCIYSSGVNPGFTEMLTYQMCCQYNPDKIEVYFSGSGSISLNAAFDMIMSCYTENSFSMSYICKDKIEKIHDYRMKKKLPLPVGETTSYPIINDSFYECIKTTNVERAYYYNTFKSQNIIMCLAMAKMEENPTESIVKKFALDLVRAFDEEASMYDNEFTMVHIIMSKDSIITRKSYIYNGNWNEMTGIIGAFVGVGINQNKLKKSGVGEAFRFIDTKWVLNNLMKDERMKLL